jgi:hypothetical protein
MLPPRTEEVVMAAERLPMRKLREIIRLRLQAGQSGRAIARSCALSPSTVGTYLGRIELAKVGWSLPPELDDDDALERLLFPDEHHPVSNRPEPDWIYVHRELQRRHVTKQLLWQEYKEATPNGLQYSQFCERYLLWARPLSATMRQVHRVGRRDAGGGQVDPRRLQQRAPRRSGRSPAAAVRAGCRSRRAGGRAGAARPQGGRAREAEPPPCPAGGLRAPARCW